jgi:hypothetical protein
LTGDASNAASAVVARPTRAGDYVATTRVVPPREPDRAMVGLAVYGDADNALGISATSTGIVVWKREKGVQQLLARASVDAGPSVDLRITARDGQRFQFAYSADGDTWKSFGDEADGGYLPPWDRAVRVTLTVGGRAGADGRFDWVRIVTGGAAD